MNPENGVETLSRKLLTSTAMLACLVLSCGQNYSDKSVADALAEKNLTPVRGSVAATSVAPAVAQSVPPYGEAAGAGDVQDWQGVHTTVPATWLAQKPSSSMRLAQYLVPAAHGGESASLAVFAGPMGTIDDNVSRWIGQFSQPDGSDSAARARRWNLDGESGVAATLVDVSGTYAGGMGADGPTDSYRMLGAIVTAGGTTLYLKLTGPAAEMADLEHPFEQMIASMRSS
jgi:hypothetical protein